MKKNRELFPGGRKPYGRDCVDFRIIPVQEISVENNQGTAKARDGAVWAVSAIPEIGF
jgi:hypothetical protein